MENCKVVVAPLACGSKFSKDDRSADLDETYYRRLIGSLLYLSASRPNVMYATSLVSRFMHKPSETHLITTKRVLRYIKGTLSYGLKFCKVEKQELQSYYDSD
ncbi:Uncharacterized protein TCM_010536 [Theobroma cacao]|uniref:Cysteine-rich RLK (RECEPTOR-like protein kinase) 8 n=1 Tax=Theobroma cacao TaxID=3641 RepID=A0A061EEE5_THECC|nr:Uncharacterized protein TCM_010536 [Theobroma cacao]